MHQNIVRVSHQALLGRQLDLQGLNLSSEVRHFHLRPLESLGVLRYLHLYIWDLTVNKGSYREEAMEGWVSKP